MDSFLGIIAVMALSIAILWIAVRFVFSFFTSPITSRWIANGLAITLYLALLIQIFSNTRGSTGSLVFWISYFVIMSGLTMPMLYRIDKNRAIDGQELDEGRDLADVGFGEARIPEISLHWLSALGGAPGAFVSQRVFRHKYKKSGFMVGYYISAFACFAFGYLVFFKYIPFTKEQSEKDQAVWQQRTEERRTIADTESLQVKGYEDYSETGKKYVDLGSPAAEFELHGTVLVNQEIENIWYGATIEKIDGARYLVKNRDNNFEWAIAENMVLENFSIDDTISVYRKDKDAYYQAVIYKKVDPTILVKYEGQGAKSIEVNQTIWVQYEDQSSEAIKVDALKLNTKP